MIINIDLNNLPERPISEKEKNALYSSKKNKTIKKLVLL
jgi:hypothetical protein